MVRQKIGQYQVVDRLGTGGMGTVYRATDEMLGREVALKVLDAEFKDSSTRFRAEAAALARLSHPGIATVYELLEDDGRLVMVMELVRGQTLQQIVEQVGVFSPPRAAELCMQVLAALAHAHSAGVVHRDLKPSNLMITETGTVKIMDFGIARLDGSVHLTNAGLMMGTPAYMAPEQVLGHPIDARVDLYAMGVVFYRLISAELPFQGETPFAMAQSQVNDAPTPIDLVRPDLPPWVAGIIARALAKAPDERFQSAMEFHEAFARCVTQPPLASASGADELTEVMVRPERPGMATAPRNSGASVQRRRMAAGISVAAVALIGALSLWILGPLDASRPRPAGESVPVAGAPGATPDDGRAASQPAALPVLQPPIAATPAEGAAAVFSNVKFLAVSGTRTGASNVVLSFSNGEIRALPGNGEAPLATVPYRRIAKATYVYARDPQWSAQASAPKDKIDVPGIFGKSRHWLVVQTKAAYTILRLDGLDWQELLKAFEARTGVTIDRPVVTGKTDK